MNTKKQEYTEVACDVISVTDKDEAGVKLNLKKCFVAFSFVLLQSGALFCQQAVYDNFEGSKLVHYGARNGVLDSLAVNPSPDDVDNSAKCAKYVRDGEKKFDNIKMNLEGRLMEVNEYATYLGNPPKLKLKIHTTAPVGTLVEILLGSKGRNNEYPAGTHSQYQAHTTVSGKWEELEFKFSQIPEGSMTSASEINQVTLLFSPNSSSMDVFYFDDLTGPPVNLALTNSKPSVSEEKMNTTKTEKTNTVKNEKANTSKNEKVNTVKKTNLKSEKSNGTK